MLGTYHQGLNSLIILDANYSRQVLDISDGRRVGRLMCGFFWWHTHRLVKVQKVQTDGQ